MKTYKYHNIYSDSLGSISPITCSDKAMESADEEFLWHINSMREHDGLPPVEDFSDISFNKTEIQS